jgi:pyruvate carboxylase
VTDAFVQEASAQGVDIFRIFDALNDVSNMKPAIDAVLATGTSVAEVALCYSGNLLDPAEDLYTLDYYLALAERIVESGAHILAIKDMAGLLRQEAATVLVTALRERFDLPVHLHTHDTAGGQLATLIAASNAGVDAVDAASGAMAGGTSQPSLSALVAALQHTARDTGLDLKSLTAMEPYWEAVRALYRPFESGIPGPTGRIYHHEIPGGQLSNLRQQAKALGLADRFEDIENWYAEASRMLGRPTKVTPSSKVVGDLALHLVAMDVDPSDFEENPGNYDVPDSVVGFMAGELGDLPGGWPEPFRTKILAGRTPDITVSPLSADQERVLEVSGRERQELLNTLLFPGPTKDFEATRETYGDISVIRTKDFLYGLELGEETIIEVEPGVRLYVSIEAISEPDERGQRNVQASLNGQIRPIAVRDKSITVELTSAEKADPANPKEIAAPFSGVVTLNVSVGNELKPGSPVATIEAMKMEAAISTPVAGTVKRLAIPKTQQVEAGDLLVELE